MPIQRKNILTGGMEYLDKSKDPINTIGEQLVERELTDLELQQSNQTLGSQIVDLDLRLLQGGM